MEKIGISTGVFFKTYEDEEINRRISHMARWNIDRIEILLSRLFLLDIPITPENKEFLKNKEVTIHAPFFENVGYTMCKLGKTEIDKLIKIGKEINAKYIVIHPDLVEDLDLIGNSDFQFAIENIKPSISKKFSLEKLERVFKKYPKLKLALDPGHAKHLSEEQIKNIAKEISKITEIVEVHTKVEDVNNFLKEGETLSFERNFNAPIILEGIGDLTKTNKIIEKIKKAF